ncbi:hypothetical protein LINPERPRIM_LOCUS42716 [Linum perenne]
MSSVSLPLTLHPSKNPISRRSLRLSLPLTLHPSKNPISRRSLRSP